MEKVAQNTTTTPSVTMPCSSICTSESSCSTCSTCSSSIRTIPSNFNDTRTLPEIEACILFRARRLMYEYNVMRKRELENGNESTASLVEVDEEQAKNDELESVQGRLEDALNVVTATERMLRELKWWDEKADRDVAWEKGETKEAKEKKEAEKKIKKKILVKGQKGKGKEVDRKVVKKAKEKMEEKKVEKEPVLINDRKGKGKQREEQPQDELKKKVPKKKENKGKGKSVEETGATTETKIYPEKPKAETSMQGAQREWGQYEWDWQGFQDSMF